MTDSDSPTGDKTQKGRREAVVMARALFGAENQNTEMTPEARKAAWQDAKKEKIQMARQVIKRLRKQGATFTLPAEAGASEED